MANPEDDNLPGLIIDAVEDAIRTNPKAPCSFG